jgi:hypothetical protein
MATKAKTTGPCPKCDGEMKPARVPTDKEYAKAFDKEQPGVLPEGSDTASPEQRAELGALYRCACGYQTRVKDAGNGASADDK